MNRDALSTSPWQICAKSMASGIVSKDGTCHLNTANTKTKSGHKKQDATLVCIWIMMEEFVIFVIYILFCLYTVARFQHDIFHSS